MSEQNKLRIALVTTEFISGPNFAGGLANYIHHITQALSHIGHEVVIFIEGDRDETLELNGFRLIRVGRRRHWGFQLIDAITFKRLSYSIGYFRLSWNLNRGLRQEHARHPFDIVQYTQLGGIGLWRLPKVPTVVRLSSYAKLWQQHGEFSGLSRFTIWQLRSLEYWAMVRSDFIFGPCQPVSAYVEHDLGRPVDTIASPYFRADFKLDDRIYSKHLLGMKYILYFGRLSPSKGILVLAKIIRGLLQSDPDCYMVFAGKETTGWQGKPIMRHIVEMAGEFHAQVINLGNLPQNQLFPIIRSAYTVVFPALVENLPNACLEAMYFERVIVATSGTGFDQLLVHGESGLLCRAGDGEALFDILGKALNMDERSRQMMGKAARAQLENFNPEKIAREHVDFYRRVITSM